MERTVQKLGSPKPDVPIRIQVAGYARVSCDKDSMLHSLSQQVSYYSSLIQSRRDWLFAGVFVDAGTSYGQKPKMPIWAFWVSLLRISMLLF